MRSSSVLFAKIRFATHDGSTIISDLILILHNFNPILASQPLQVTDYTHIATVS